MPKKQIKFFLLGLIVVLTVCFWPVAQCAADVTLCLNWNANTEQDLAGYHLYAAYSWEDLTARRYASLFDVVRNQSASVPIDVPAVRSSYCIKISDADYKRGVVFCVTAYDTANLESDYSNLVAAFCGNIVGDSSDGVPPEQQMVDGEDYAEFKYLWETLNTVISHLTINCAVDVPDFPAATHSQKADFNHDGTLNFFDLGVIAPQFGRIFNTP
ncbi:MAG: hypothetical protein V1698_03340 [bacterium]